MRLLEQQQKQCVVCHKETKHVWVRNMTFEYWRCEECLIEQLHRQGFFSPRGCVPWRNWIISKGLGH